MLIVIEILHKMCCFFLNLITFLIPCQYNFNRWFNLRATGLLKSSYISLFYLSIGNVSWHARISIHKHSYIKHKEDQNWKIFCFSRYFSSSLIIFLSDQFTISLILHFVFWQTFWKLWMLIYIFYYISNFVTLLWCIKINPGPKKSSLIFVTAIWMSQLLMTLFKFH